MRLKNRLLAMPIAAKLTVWYAVMLTCILLLTSALTVGGLYYVLSSQAQADMAASRDWLVGQLADGHKINQHLLDDGKILPGVLLHITDEDNHTVLASGIDFHGQDSLGDELEDDGVPMLFFASQTAPIRIVRIDKTYFYYLCEDIYRDGHLYQLHFFKAVSEQKHFFKMLVESLAVTNLIGLFIAILSGMYLSRKLLRPLRNITATARAIEVSDLDKRIEVPCSHDELHELARTFNHMLNRLQAGFEDQRRFVGDASHELRTPITVISGYANMLDRWGKEDPAVLAEAVEAIKSEATNMYNLVEKLLFLARADQNRQNMEKRVVDMKALLQEVAQETKLIAADHQVVLADNEAGGVYADIGAIKQMLRIFIENSIKYTPAGGTITLSACRQDGKLAVTVADNGVGIPKEEQTKIFERFYRVDRSRSKTTGGNGLGLAIARWIAQRHDMEILVDSEVNQGTAITVLMDIVEETSN